MKRICILILVCTPLLAEDYRISEEELTRLDELISSLETQLNEQQTELSEQNSEISELGKEISHLKTLSTKQRESLERSETELRRARIVARIELAVIIGLLITLSIK